MSPSKISSDENETSEVQWFHAPHKDAICSEPLFRYLSEEVEVINGFLFDIRMAKNVDFLLKSAAEVVKDPKLQENFSKDIMWRSVRLRSESISKTLVNNLVNNFLTYLSEVLQLVVVAKPEVLRSSEKTSTEEILQFHEMSDVVSYIADRKINELSYGGLKGIEEFVSSRLGLALFDDGEQRKLLTIFVELRNLNTHNRGRVNDLFLSRVAVIQSADFKFTKGKPFHTDFDTLVKLSRNANRVALDLDNKLATKFKLKRDPFADRFRATKKAQFARFGFNTSPSIEPSDEQCF